MIIIYGTRGGEGVDYIIQSHDGIIVLGYYIIKIHYVYMALGFLWFVVIINKIYNKKASFEKSLFFIGSQGGAWARFVAFVFVADAFALCGAFLGLLRGCAGSWCKNSTIQIAQIWRFDFWLIL